MSESQPVELDQLPSAQQLLIDDALYTQHRLKNCHAMENAVYDFLAESLSVDAFCPSCKNDTVIICGKTVIGEYGRPGFNLGDAVFTKTFYCSRRACAFRFYFTFCLSDYVFQKIGQFPSKSDLDESNLKHYSKVLERSDFRELNRGVGLAAHGVGIGSFVYLRRIFERLVEDAHKEAMSSGVWSDETYSPTLRMEDKIQRLQDYLPTFLVSERKVYSILSVGIHALEEEECLAYFPVVKAGIELMLDEKIARKKREKMATDAKKQIREVHQKLGERTAKATDHTAS